MGNKERPRRDRGDWKAQHDAFQRHVAHVAVKRPAVQSLPDALGPFLALRDIHLATLDADSFPRPNLVSCERSPYEAHPLLVTISDGNFLAPDAPPPGVGMEQWVSGRPSLHQFCGWWERIYVADGDQDVEIVATLSWYLSGKRFDPGVEPGLYRVRAERDVVCAFAYRLEPSQFGRASIDVHSAVYAGDSTNPSSFTSVVREVAATPTPVVASKMICLPLGDEYLIEIRDDASGSLVATSITTFKLSARAGGRASLMIWRYGILNFQNLDVNALAGDTVFNAVKIKDIDTGSVPTTGGPGSEGSDNKLSCKDLCTQHCALTAEIAKLLKKLKSASPQDKPAIVAEIEAETSAQEAVDLLRESLGCSKCHC